VDHLCLVAFVFDHVLQILEYRFRVQVHCVLFLQVPADLEVAYVPCTSAGMYPGLFLSTTPSRLLRPVKQLQGEGAVELIGPLEQVIQVSIQTLLQTYKQTGHVQTVF
jgi:hypothetical protein